jgi:DNA-binding protein H-NS
MSEFLRIITHVRRFKSSVKDIGVEHLKEVRDKLDKIIADRKAEEEAELLNYAEKIEKIKKYQEMLSADGISLDELQGSGSGKSMVRTPRPPKYEIWNEAGKRITWTGQGRMPNIFKARIEEGEVMDTFLIED